uniref:Uncharacterized protein n=1 Tax=Onchocerca volvulus TaxID=6282 RepID=A0A8R1XRX8_ONCVO
MFNSCSVMTINMTKSLIILPVIKAVISTFLERFSHNEYNFKSLNIFKIGKFPTNIELLQLIYVQYIDASIIYICHCSMKPSTLIKTLAQYLERNFFVLESLS